ncbi:MAG: glycosyltransferase, partial [Candidatus Hydrothermia bacterium]
MILHRKWVIILWLRRFLYISYYFPPCGLSGVMRAAKFAKYLPRYGWKPIVLCAGGFRFLAEDKTLLDELPDDVRIERVSVPEPYSLAAGKPHPKSKALGASLANWFSFPDTRRLWIGRGFRRGLEIVSNEKPSAILATSPPYSSFILGRRLSEKTDLPLVLDYRDLWLGNKYRVYPTGFHASWNVKAERGVLSRAAAVIAINEVMA